MKKLFTLLALMLCYVGMAGAADVYTISFNGKNNQNLANKSMGAKLVTEYSQQGNYDSSRMIGTKLYNVSTYYVNVRADDYRDNCIPETEINGDCEKIPADCISVIEESESSSYAVITTIDVENDTEPYCEAILGNCDELYASSKGLFISETAYNKKTYEEIVDCLEHSNKEGCGEKRGLICCIRSKCA